MTPAPCVVAEILWHRHGTARQSPAAFADEAAEILAALEPHRRHELKEARRRGFEEAMEEARGLPPLAASSPTGTPDLPALLRLAAEGRREYRKSHYDGTEIALVLDSEAATLDSAAKLAGGDRTPLYGWLPVGMWTPEMHARPAAGRQRSDMAESSILGTATAAGAVRSAFAGVGAAIAAGSTGTPGNPVWLCGAFSRSIFDLAPYRCTEPNGHEGHHRTVIDDEVHAEWPRKPGAATSPTGDPTDATE